MTEVLTVTQTANRLSISKQTVHQWIRSGVLHNAYQLSPVQHSQWRIPEADVKAIELARQKQVKTVQEAQMTYLGKCSECQGDGWIENTAWREFGQSDLSATQFAQRNGPEEMSCEVCHGTGRVPTPEGAAILDLLYWQQATELRRP